MKRKISILLMLIIFGLSGLIKAQIPTDSLIGYWPFNGNTNDESGNNYHGTVNGAILTTDRFNNYDSAYEFDGVDDIITLPNNTLGNWSELTFSIWVKGPEYTGNYWPNFIGSWDSFGYKNTAIGIYKNTGHLHLEVYTDINFYPMEGTLNIPWGYWFHAVLVYDGSTLTEYINGVRGKSISASGNLEDISDLTFGLASPNNPTFDGKLDDIRIYNRALNESEIYALHNEREHRVDTITDYNLVSYQNTIKIFPNPVNDYITISFGSNFSTMNGYTLKITNTLSQTVYKASINSNQTTIDLSTLTGYGIYFVHLMDAQNNTIDVRKIVLQ